MEKKEGVVSSSPRQTSSVTSYKNSCILLVMDCGCTRFQMLWNRTSVIFTRSLYNRI